MNKTFECIASEVTNLHFRWMVFRNVYAIDEKHIELLNYIDSCFFGTVQHIYWDAIILNITKLTDPMKTGSNYNLTLERVWHEYKDELSDTCNDKICELLNDLRADLAKLKIHRSKRLAHLDYIYGMDNETYDLGEISRADIEHILSLTREFLNEIQGEIEGTPTLYEDIIGVDGGIALFEKLKKLEPDGTDFRYRNLGCMDRNDE